MKPLVTLAEQNIQTIGHAFGCYDYGAEHGLIDAFPSRDAVAAFIYPAPSETGAYWQSTRIRSAICGPKGGTLPKPT